MRQEIKQKVNTGHLVFHSWKKVPFSQRQTHLLKLAGLLSERKNHYAKIITSEMNKPISQAVAEIEKCALMAEYYGGIEDVLRPEKVKTELHISEIYHEAMGVILGVMPWNFPFWQALRFAVPTILAGNAVVLKHASICLKSGDELQQLFSDAGFPAGVFQHLIISHEEVEELMSFTEILGVSLTGSEAAGRKIAEAAGRNLKKCVLELGGSDAFIVLNDANLQLAAENAALGRLQNCGQTCVAAKRFIVLDSVYEEFLKKFKTEYLKYVPGNPDESQTKLSGMARADLADDLSKQYETALENGAEAIIPLERTSDLTFNPGLLKMNGENPVLQEELFGPLGMVFKVKTEQEALELANSVQFGLGNSVWTTSEIKACFFAKNLESGTVAINQIVKSDPRLPFGGTKNSGYGVELSPYALHEFTSLKTIMGNI